MARFSVGDTVVLVGNTNNDKHNIGWCAEMYDMIGQEFVVGRVHDWTSYAFYRLDGDEHRFAFDEDWLEAVVYEEASAELESFILEFQK